MIDLLYNIIIFPLVQIIEIAFVVVHRIFKDNVLAISGVSLAVSVCTLPLYLTAEKWQQTERNLQRNLKPEIDLIKSVFSGDKRFMLLQTYYRQNNYHPVYAFRNTFGILIQIPFFLAAYSYLSNLESLKGTSFLFIRDLGNPDRLFSLGGFSVNALPVLMTLINYLSAAVYTKGFTAREKIQIYGMPLIFLVLLYNSPSGLVLYWTMNNIFSLAKNIVSQKKHGKLTIYIFFCFCAAFADFHLFRIGFSPKRLFVAGFCSLVFFVPLFIRLFKYCKEKFSGLISLENTSLGGNGTYILSVLILFFLSGPVIPGSLIASSVQEFSFLDSYTTPLPFIYTVSLQAMGFFLFWPLCVYFLFQKKTRYTLAFILSLLAVLALVNTYLFPGDYGVITTTFRFANPDTFESKYKIIILSGISTLGILAIFSWLLLSKRKIIFQSFQLITLAALIFLSIFNIHKINSGFKSFEHLKAEAGTGDDGLEEPEPVYHFTKNGKNVVVFMLDAAMSGYIPYIFKEKPELLSDFSGFTYYPNCISFGAHTRIGAPVIFGGYEYEPALIQLGRSFAMEKHNEALLMMPRIFSKEGYRVTATDPAFANYSLTPDLSIFEPYPEISARNILGEYTGMWLRSHTELNIVSVPELLRELLFRFSLLKISPPAFRVFIYDKSEWLKGENALTKNDLSLNILDNYATLDYFPQITKITEETANTYTSIVNELPHDSAVFSHPDYAPSTNITNPNDSPFPGSSSYFDVNTASLLLIGKWLRFLREQDVYDNTRIIFASDHGRGVAVKYTGNIQLPNGEWLSGYNALLLVKDFNARGNLASDDTFMTNADIPLIAMKDLIENPNNPFSGNPVKSGKENGVLITTTSALQFTIESDQWLRVRDNIFNPDNWEKATK